MSNDDRILHSTIVDKENPDRVLNPVRVIFAIYLDMMIRCWQVLLALFETGKPGVNLAVLLSHCPLLHKLPG